MDDHVADRGADDRHERARFGDAGSRQRHERVDVSDRDRRRARQTYLVGESGAKRARALAQGDETVAELRARLVEAWIGSLKKPYGREPRVRRPQRLVARCRPLASFDPSHVPDDPVGCLDVAIRRVVELAVLEP